MKRLRIRYGTVGVATAALLAGSVAAMGSVNAPKTGAYHGTAENGSREGEGLFKLKKTTAGRYVIVAYPSYGIISPSEPRDTSPKACNQFNAKLPVSRIRVRSGRFRWEGDAPIGYLRPGARTAPPVHVIFKGRWISKTTLVGTTRFQRGNCDDTRRWTMKTPPPDPYR